MSNEKSNLLKMATGTIATTVFFAAMGLFISVYLPDSSESVPVGGSFLSGAAAADEAASRDTEELAVQEDGADGQVDAVNGEELAFLGDEAAETDVGTRLDFVSYEAIDDTELVLYRNLDTRSYVEWFYTKVTGNREVALAILDAASQFNVSPSLAFALAYTESKYVTDAVHTNVNGSIDRGLFQLNSYSFPKLTEEEFYDAATSAYYGMSHLNHCLEVSASQIAGLAMYNAGRNKVNGDRTPVSTLNYISKILDYKAKIDSKFSTEILAFYSDGNGGSGDRYLAKF